jgi:transcriptional regulator with XRE-family HTH domain
MTGQPSATANVAQHMRRWRQRQERPQRFLAQRVNEHGLAWTQPIVSQIELGHRHVTVEELVALAAALDMSPAALLKP